MRTIQAFRYVVTLKCSSKLYISLVPSAGRENRTPVSSLARMRSTTKPYPLSRGSIIQ